MAGGLEERVKDKFLQMEGMRKDDQKSQGSLPLQKGAGRHWKEGYWACADLASRDTKRGKKDKKE